MTTEQERKIIYDYLVKCGEGEYAKEICDDIMNNEWEKQDFLEYAKDGEIMDPMTIMWLRTID